MANLTETPRSALARCERIISAGLESFIDVGNALAEVRDGKLYGDKYKTFEDYCEKRWEFGPRRGYMLISAAEVAASVNHGSHPVANERQARALGAAPKKDRKKVMKKAAAVAGDKPITAAIITQVIESDTVPLNDVMKKDKKPAKPKPEKKPDAPKPEKVIDGCGNVVTGADMIGTFNSRAGFKNVQNLIRGVQRALAEMGNPEHKGGTAFMDIESLGRTLDSVWAAIKFDQPYALCPLCKGKSCKHCRNLGFMPKKIYSVVPEDQRWPEAVGTS